jgi:outer membrane receptor protein involved in Fe transport
MSTLRALTVPVLTVSTFLPVGPASQADEPRSAPTLGEVIVTATRRQEPLHAVNLSATALTGEEVRDSGIHDLDDLLDRVPGLSFTNDGFPGYRIAVRGITSGTIAEARPLTAFYLDETPLMTLTGTAAAVAYGGPRVQAVDLERLEVSRGPQGTLFGTSAMGGAVRMIMYRPDVTRMTWNATAGYSSTARGGDNLELDAILNLPLAAGQAAARISGFHREIGGFTDNIPRSVRDVDAADISGGRLALLWNASGNLTVLASVHGQHRAMDGLSAADVSAGRYSQARWSAEQDDETWWLYNLTLDYELPGAQLRSITSYLDRRPDYAFDITAFVDRVLGVFSPTWNQFDDRVRDVIQEIRLVSQNESHIAWLVGAYYQSQDRWLKAETPSPGFDALTGGLAASFGYPDTLGIERTDASLRQRAFYGEASLALAPHWEVTAGARWFRFDQEVEQLGDGLFNAGRSVLNGSSREEGVTPRIGIAYRPYDGFHLYANAAQGFRPGGSNQFNEETVELCADELEQLGYTGVPPPFESDSLWSYELGGRMRAETGTFLLDGALYYIDWDDMQTLKALQCGLGFAENAGHAVSKGAELELQWRPTRALDLAIALAYTDVRLAEDAPNVSGEEGERIPTVARWAASVSARQEFALSRRWQGFVQADYRFVDATWNDFDQAIRVRVPSRQLVNLRAGLDDGRWSVEVFADNTLDERAVLAHSNNLVGEWQVIAPPRTFGVRVRTEH